MKGPESTVSVIKTQGTVNQNHNVILPQTVLPCC